MVGILRRILVVLVILYAGSSAANACDAVIPFAWQPKLHNSPYDANDNQVDDALEALGPTTFVDPLVALADCPRPGDRTRLSTFGTIDFDSRYLPVIHMTGVQVSRLVQLAKDPVVAFVEQNAPLYHTLSTSNPAIKVKASLEYSPLTIHDKFTTLRGDGVNIAIVDFGVDDQAGAGATHGSLPAGRFRGGLVCGLLSCADGNPNDAVGGGTAVAGIAVGEGEGGIDPPHEGLAPEAGFFDVQLSSVIILRRLGLHTAIDAVLQKANSSGWSVQVMEIPFSDCIPSNGTDTVSASVNAAANRGIAVVTGMGNCSTCMSVNRCSACPCSLVGSPAAADGAITVGFVDDLATVSRGDDALSDDSLRGPRLDDFDSTFEDERKPDLVAPGVNIASPLFDTVGAYMDRSGSSLASAHAAGCAALMMQVDPLMRPWFVQETIRWAAEDRGPVGWEADWGFGLLDCFKAVDRINDLFCSELFVPGACGDRPLPPCSLHPGLRAENPEIREGIPNTVIVDIRNNGPALVSDDYIVKIGVNNHWNGDQGYEICSVRMPGLASGETAQATCDWTPFISGGAPGVVHACLYAEIVAVDDCTRSGNRVQHNINIEQAFSPAEEAMLVVNPTDETLTMELKPTFDCAGGACPGWVFTPSDNLFLLGPDECPRNVVLRQTPGPGAVRESTVHVAVEGHTSGGGILNLGGVSFTARLACPTTNLRFTSNSTFQWTPPQGFSACPQGSHDIIRGMLPISKYNSMTMRGDFSSASCLANEIPAMQFTDSDPPQGRGFYYLTRAGGTLPGSWDLDDAGQAGLADDTLKVCQ